MLINSPYSPDDLTEDALFEGRILLLQPRKGYRFSVDAPLLTWFATENRVSSRCADLGSGSGAVGIGLLATRSVTSVVAVEIQPGLASLSLTNAATNGFSENYHLVHGDMRASHPLLETGAFDLVVSNPPFWPSDSGRLPASEERRIACHEINVQLDEVIATASRLLHPRRGRFCIIFPARRLEYLMATLMRFHLNATRMIFVYPRQHDNAGWVLLQARHGHSEHLDVLPSIVLKDEEGNDTTEGASVLSGAFSEPLRTIADRRPTRT